MHQNMPFQGTEFKHISTERAPTPHAPSIVVLSALDCPLHIVDPPLCITLGGRLADNTRWSHILVENRDFCLPHPFDSLVRGSPSEYCHNIWSGKTRMV